MKLKVLLSMLLVIVMAALPVMAAPPERGAAISVPVTGTFNASSTAGPLSQLGSGTLTGVLNIQNFVNQGGTLVAVGTLTSTLTNTATGAVTTLVQQVSVP